MIILKDYGSSFNGTVEIRAMNGEQPFMAVFNARNIDAVFISVFSGLVRVAVTTTGDRDGLALGIPFANDDEREAAISRANELSRFISREVYLSSRVG